MNNKQGIARKVLSQDQRTILLKRVHRIHNSLNNRSLNKDLHPVAMDNLIDDRLRSMDLFMHILFVTNVKVYYAINKCNICRLPRPPQLAELLDLLLDTQSRLRPHIERYRKLMRDDPSLPPGVST